MIKNCVFFISSLLFLVHEHTPIHLRFIKKEKLGLSLALYGLHDVSQRIRNPPTTKHEFFFSLLNTFLYISIMSEATVTSTNTTPTTPTTPTTAPEQTLHKVFVANLNFKTTNEGLETFLQDAGKVVEATVIKHGRRAMGYGFGAFSTLEEAQKAAQDLNNKTLDGREIRIQVAHPQVKKNKRKRASKKARKNAENSSDDGKSEKSEKPEKPEKTEKSIENKDVSVPTHSAFVANLPFKVNVTQLKELFKEYKVTFAMVARQKTKQPGRRGRSKGYGFVELESAEELQRVLKKFGTVELEGRTIHVRAAVSEKKQSVKGSAEEKINDEEKPKKSKRSKRRSNKKKQKEALDAVKEAEEGIKEVKKDDGIKAAKEAAEGVKEVKKEDGVKAAKEAAEGVKEVKKEDGVKAAKEAVEGVKEVKKEDGVKAAKEAAEGVKEVKKEDGVKAAKEADKEVKKEEVVKKAQEPAEGVKEVKKEEAKEAKKEEPKEVKKEEPKEVKKEEPKEAKKEAPKEVVKDKK
ncbi:unnamed protein product [Rhizopus stolonifer]